MSIAAQNEYSSSVQVVCICSVEVWLYRVNNDLSVSEEAGQVCSVIRRPAFFSIV